MFGFACCGQCICLTQDSLPTDNLLKLEIGKSCQTGFRWAPNRVEKKQYGRGREWKAHAYRMIFQVNCQGFPALEVTTVTNAGWHLNKPGSKVDFGRDPVALLPSLAFALADTWIHNAVKLLFWRLTSNITFPDEWKWIHPKNVDVHSFVLSITNACVCMCLSEVENHPVQNWHHEKKRPEFTVNTASLDLVWNTTTGRCWRRGEKENTKGHWTPFPMTELGDKSPWGC